MNPVALTLGKEVPIWFVMRDLRRANAKEHAVDILAARGYEVFTPLVVRTKTERGRKVTVKRPFITTAGSHWESSESERVKVLLASSGVVRSCRLLGRLLRR